MGHAFGALLGVPLYSASVLRAELRQDKAEIKAEMKEDRAEIKAEIKANNAEIKADMSKIIAKLDRHLEANHNLIGRSEVLEKMFFKNSDTSPDKG